MASPAPVLESIPFGLRLVLDVPPRAAIDDEAFFDLCGANANLRLERTAEGNLVIMSPTGGETGSRNSELTMQLRAWAKRDQSGAAFDSNTAFRLADTSILSPDASWVRRSRLETLTPDEKRRFLPLAPDFVAELTSPSDRVEAVRRKMERWLANGVRLGWLLDPERRLVEVYRPDENAEVIENPDSVTGGPVLPGFALELADIWDPGF